MEKINELSKGTLKSYIKRSANDIDKRSFKMGTSRRFSDKQAEYMKSQNKVDKRKDGIKRATDKLEEENLDRFFYTVDGSDKGMYVDAASRTEAIQKVEAKTGKKPVTIKLATDDKPMNENINQFIVSALSDNGSEVKSRIHSELSERITSALDTRKQEIAQSLFVPMQEEVEQIDELSGQTVSNYSKVAAHDKKKQEKDAAYHRGEQEKHEKSHGPMSKELASSHAKHAERSERSASNREMGLVKANKRLNPVKDTEETVNEDQLNELSKNTLKSYVKKAVNRVGGHSYLRGKDSDKSHYNKDIMKKYTTNGQIVQKKKVGIERATERLSK